MTQRTRISSSRSIGTTRPQREVMEAIQRSIDEQGHLPTFREVADRLGVCLNNVTQMLYRLRRDGMVEWKDGKARTLRLTHGEHEQAEGQGG